MARGADVVRSLPGPVLIGVVLFTGMSVRPVRAQEAGESKRFEIILANGRVADGMRSVRALRGDRVELLWSSDRLVTIHLHGYDIEAVVEPGSQGRMTFTAHATGRFPVELHGGTGRHRTLIHVEVHPR
ncbi:hypothetical protein [Microvirga aerophila]|uniref:EfeO-type cupredoxin-like domain-containing protein n=1 Tax=Microvirga aerophila TaxID=670291 RepID=A0A512C580_9HYPH|nr:hypothetical protein [Microvirga aerophila]GEO19351.1 hypothetical protein MAE02_70470 [Microvirga aerophila]